MKNMEKAKLEMNFMESTEENLTEIIKDINKCDGQGLRVLLYYQNSLVEEFKAYQKSFATVTTLISTSSAQPTDDELDEATVSAEYKGLASQVNAARRLVGRKFALEEDKAGFSSQTHAQSGAKTKMPKITHRPFDETNPDLWFIELENQFCAQEITEEKCMFAALQPLLGKPQSNGIQDVTRECQALTDPYSKAKKKLVDLYRLKPHDAIQQAWDVQYDSDEKPSQFLGRIKTILVDVTMDDVETYLITRSLPHSVRNTLQASTKTSSEQVATQADALILEEPRRSQPQQAVNYVVEVCDNHKKDKSSKQCLSSWKRRCLMWVAPSLCSPIRNNRRSNWKSKKVVHNIDETSGNSPGAGI